MPQLTLSCPPEPVRRTWLGWSKSKTIREFLFGTLQAQPIVATMNNVVAPDGSVGYLEITFPLCDVHRTGLFRFMVDAVECPATLTWTLKKRTP